MVAFKGFQPPKQRIVLKNDQFEAEIWPEVAGAVARFEEVDSKGNRRSLFRQATEGKASYTAPDDMGIWPIVPFSNRIDHGKMHFNGKVYDLAPNFGDNPHALHGVGWQRPWTVLEQTPDLCRLGLNHAPDQNWPFAFASEVTYKLTAQGLTSTLSLQNTDENDMPYGLGFHPYFYRDKGSKLFANVDQAWLCDEHAMATECVALPQEWNLPKGCLLDDNFIDNCFVPFAGEAKVVWADGASLTVSGSDELTYLVVYNPDGQKFVCVEPVSHMIDGFNRHAKGEKNVGFTVLRPQERKTIVNHFVYAPK